jgi:hypothetical protein
MFRQWAGLLLIGSLLLAADYFSGYSIARASSDPVALTVQVYSITSNPSGRVVKTSIGVFYIGKSGDAIHEASGRKRYGYWEQNGSVVVVYIEREIYAFPLVGFVGHEYN